MRPIRDALRLIAEGKHSQRSISRMCRISRKSIAEYLMRLSEAGLSWSLPGDLDDAGLEARLFPSATKQTSKFPQHVWLEVEKEILQVQIWPTQH